MVIPKLALKNLLGAGLRTWLNVLVLSFSFVAIIWTQGLYQGMNNQAEQSLIDTYYGGGQYWHENYDPYDPLTLEDSHAVPSQALITFIKQKKATPILLVQGYIYPQGRLRAVVMNGIDPEQNVLTLPTHFLSISDFEIPAMIGTRMAQNTGLAIGDRVTLQWRDTNGTFDARDITIVQIMKTTVQKIDNNQVWIPLEKLRNMMGMPGEASMVILKQNTKAKNVSGWSFKNQSFLLEDIRMLVKQKTIGASIIYFILLLLAMLAIFDTQILSIFRRKKEMGTLMALGMTRVQIIKLFTLEGALHGILAACVAALYGIPLLTYSAQKGWALPQSTDTYGIAIGEKLFPEYGAGLVIGTTILVLVITTIVSYLPTRRITHLKPTDALRGKLS